jgi:hypothetical protein
MRIAPVVAAALLAGGPTATAADGPVEYAPEQVKSAVEQHVARKVAEGGGIYRLVDERTGQEAELEFRHVAVVSPAAIWGIHDPAQKAAQGWFACTLFHPVGAPHDEVWDVDVAVQGRESGLAVTGAHVHKVKQLVEGKWVWREPSAAAKAAR